MIQLDCFHVAAHGEGLSQDEVFEKKYRRVVRDITRAGGPEAYLENMRKELAMATRHMHPLGGDDDGR